MWQFLKNMRIRNKLFVGYSFLFLVGASASGVAIYSQVRAIIQQSMESELLRTTQTIANTVQADAGVSLKNYLRAIAEEDFDLVEKMYNQVHEGFVSEAEAQQRLREYFSQQKVGTGGYIYCLSSKGEMLIHPQDVFHGKDISNLAFAKKQIEQKRGFLKYSWEKLSGGAPKEYAAYMEYFEPWDWIITVITPIDDFEQLVESNDYRKRLLDLGFGKSGYPFIMSYDGSMVIHPYLNGGGVASYDNSRLKEIANRILAEKKGAFDYFWKNPGEKELRHKIVYFTNIPEMNWIVASTCYYDDFYGPLKSIGVAVIGISAMLLVLMIPLTMGMSLFITRPIKRLQNSFSRAAEGDFGVRMDVCSKDELGILTGYFNQFMEHLNTYNDDLQNEISERKKVEKELIAIDKAKTLFISSASHELRTPLTSIIGFLKLLEKNFNTHFMPFLMQQPEIEKDLKRYQMNLSVVRSESDRLGRLVNDLLDLNKIGSGQMEWRNKMVSVTELLKRASDSISGFAAENPELTFETVLPENDIMINIDADRIHQVFINLLNNAFKYTDTGGVILSALVLVEGIEFSICDTGRGIPAENRERVFDVFYQVTDENERSSKTFGTGLGLAICRQIVLHYGGTITVEPNQKQGSCFRVFLPKDLFQGESSI